MVRWELFTSIQLKNQKKNFLSQITNKGSPKNQGMKLPCLKCTIICIQNLGWLNNIFFLSVQKRLSYQKEKGLLSKFISN